MMAMIENVRWSEMMLYNKFQKSDPVCKSQLAEQQQAKKRGAARQLLKKGGTARQFAKNKIILFAKKMFYSSICRADFRFNLLQKKSVSHAVKTCKSLNHRLPFKVN